MDRIAREPAVTIGSVVTAVGAVIAALVALDILHLTAEQQGVVMAAVLAVLVVLWPVLVWLRSVVTPVADPRLPDGQAVTLHDGAAGTVTRK